MDWPTYFLNIADTVRQKSKDPSTQIGVVIVGSDNQILSTGFNGSPRGVEESDPTRWERPAKYDYVEHAERNAIYNAARHGVALRGCTMYMIGLGHPAAPCTDCARAVIQAGIEYVYVRCYKEASERWGDNLRTAAGMLAEAGVRVTEVQ